MSVRPHIELTEDRVEAAAKAMATHFGMKWEIAARADFMTAARVALNAAFPDIVPEIDRAR
jgi:hypothetical protein